MLVYIRTSIDLKFSVFKHFLFVDTKHFILLFLLKDNGTKKISMQNCSIDVEYSICKLKTPWRIPKTDKVIVQTEANKPKSSVDVEISLLLVWLSIDFPVPEAFRILESSTFFSVSGQWQSKKMGLSS